MTVLVYVLAVIIDLIFRELPSVIHPVIWIGKVTNLYKKIFIPEHNSKDLLKSIGLIITFLLIFILPLFFIDNFIIEAIIFSTTFSYSYFYKEIKSLFYSVSHDDIDISRKKLSYLVSRDTSGLDKQEIAEAGIETCVENITDSITSPVFYFIIGGVPLAMFYRIVNTLDAMVGYKDKYYYYGKIPARLDDILNFIPARITLLILYIIAVIKKENMKNINRVLLKDRYNTKSPNSGLSMAFIAGVLNCRLTKRNSYSIGDGDKVIGNDALQKVLFYFRTSVLVIYCLIFTSIFVAGIQC